MALHSMSRLIRDLREERMLPPFCLQTQTALDFQHANLPYRFQTC